MNTVPGSPLRKALFWTHLACGLAAGAVILSLSVTGVLLAYEKQIVAWSARGNHVAAEGRSSLGAERLAEIVRSKAPDLRRFNLVFDADPSAPVTASQGRDFSLLLNPYSGDVIVDAAAGAREFFQTTERWHRWLGGDPRGARASVVDIANLLFLLMVISGIYLWFPHVWRWRTLRGLLLFRSRYVTARLREFGWHHVFGFWMLIPLFLIALSGVVMSFPWANNLVYAAFGETAPQRRGPERAERPGPGTPANLDALLAAAKSQGVHWQRLTLPVGGPGERVDITAELPSSQPRPPRVVIALRVADASLVNAVDPSGAASGGGPQSRGQRARSWLRFVHTGEQYGIVGQTLAALGSIAACFLVYTGLALAFRRLLLPWWRPRQP